MLQPNSTAEALACLEEVIQHSGIEDLEGAREQCSRVSRLFDLVCTERLDVPAFLRGAEAAATRLAGCNPFCAPPEQAASKDSGLSADRLVVTCVQATCATRVPYLILFLIIQEGALDSLPASSIFRLASCCSVALGPGIKAARAACNLAEKLEHPGQQARLVPFAGELCIELLATVEQALALLQLLGSRQPAAVLRATCCQETKLLDFWAGAVDVVEWCWRMEGLDAPVQELLHVTCELLDGPLASQGLGSASEGSRKQLATLAGAQLGGLCEALLEECLDPATLAVWELQLTEAVRVLWLGHPERKGDATPTSAAVTLRLMRLHATGRVGAPAVAAAASILAHNNMALLPPMTPGPKRPFVPVSYFWGGLAICISAAAALLDGASAARGTVEQLLGPLAAPLTALLDYVNCQLWDSEGADTPSAISREGLAAALAATEALQRLSARLLQLCGAEASRRELSLRCACNRVTLKLMAHLMNIWELTAEEMQAVVHVVESVAKLVLLQCQLAENDPLQHGNDTSILAITFALCNTCPSMPNRNVAPAALPLCSARAAALAALVHSIVGSLAALRQGPRNAIRPSMHVQLLAMWLSQYPEYPLRHGMLAHLGVPRLLVDNWQYCLGLGIQDQEEGIHCALASLNSSMPRLSRFGALLVVEGMLDGTVDWAVGVINGATGQPAAQVSRALGGMLSLIRNLGSVILKQVEGHEAAAALRSWASRCSSASQLRKRAFWEREVGQGLLPDLKGWAEEVAAQARPDDGVMRLQLARTLAYNRACAYLGCTNVRGCSEGRLWGRRCGGCGVARFCSEQCQLAAWGQHALVCAKLAAEGPGGGGQAS